MKYIKLFEDINLENVKKYPYLFNIFTNLNYLKEEEYDYANQIMKRMDDRGLQITTPIILDNTLFDLDSNINLSHSLITSLPDDLTIKGHLNLEKSVISELPKNLKVGQSLDLTETSIETIPEDLIVGGNLLLDRTNIKTLPNNLKVNGVLSLRGSQIEYLPTGLEVTKILDVSFCKNLKNLPSDIKIGKDLYIYNTDVEVPKNLNIKGKIEQ